jgi:hypothetical protein
MKPTVKLIVFCCSTLLASSLFAKNHEEINIPVAEKARVFAKFIDEYPAVINYFTPLSEQDVIAFYQAHYGELISEERKRGRLMLKFSTNTNTVRVVVSEQNKLRQVDVLVEKVKK